MEPGLPDASEILAFWAWFAAVANELEEDFLNEALQDELQARLSCFGEVTWELGPGVTAENALAISPDGDPDLVPTTRRIVAMAPDLPRWEFHSTRPAKAEAFEFSIRTSDADEVAIDARSWRYVLFGYPDKTFDIVLEQGNLRDASEDERYTAAVVLLDALLGEGKRLLLIGDIEPVVALRPEVAVNASPISVLAEHLGARC